MVTCKTNTKIDTTLLLEGNLNTWMNSWKSKEKVSVFRETAFIGAIWRRIFNKTGEALRDKVKEEVQFFKMTIEKTVVVVTVHAGSKWCGME